MKIVFKNIFAIVLLALFVSCSNTDNKLIKSVPSKVEIVPKGKGFELLINGEIFKIKGAGINWDDGHNFKALYDAGGNSFRTWNPRKLGQELDSASKYGFMVAAGFDLEKELHGFDYSDSLAVLKQTNSVKLVVDTYKNHPNLLCWVVGNEMNLKFDDDGGLMTVGSETYISLREIVDYIHENDPNHPVTTTFAGINKEHIDLAYKHCPELDFLSVQVYGELGEVPYQIKEIGYSGPYMVTEFGPKGHWELPTTEWGREIEEPSAAKGKGLIDRLTKATSGDSIHQAIGYYAFEWGQKQERTPTWYGMFNKSGATSSRIDELTKWWSDAYPANRAPLVDSIKLNNRAAIDNIYLTSGAEYSTQVYYSDPEEDSLTFEWEVLEEVKTKSQGGAFEKQPTVIPIAILSNENGYLTFIAPKVEGEYRLFSYVYDPDGKVGNANIPFFVKEKSSIK